MPDDGMAAGRRSLLRRRMRNIYQHRLLITHAPRWAAEQPGGPFENKSLWLKMWVNT